MAVAVHTINVAEGTDKDEKQILDLGKLVVKPNTQLCKGQAAPLFDIKTLDGKRIRLQDLRGEIVLLAFWASWCGECTNEVPRLKELYEAFGNNERFVMIGLSLDSSTQTLQNFVKRHEMNWTQGILGDWSQSKIPSLYAVSFIPTAYLIDQNGFVVDVLRGLKMHDAIEKALAGLE